MARRITLIMMIFVAIASAGTWWVHSANGNDAYPGSSADSAFASLGAAANAMSCGDTCNAAGVFHETLTLSSGSHEGCLFREWSDSAYWTVDGDFTRECVYLGSGLGDGAERAPVFHNLKATEGSSNCVRTLADVRVCFIACSLSTSGGNTGIWQSDRGFAHIESCYVSGDNYASGGNGAAMLALESSFQSSNCCFYTGNDGWSYRSRGCDYSGVDGFDLSSCSGYRGSFRLAEDRFELTGTIFDCDGAPASIDAIKCFFTGADRVISGGDVGSPEVTMINCTVESTGCAFATDGPLTMMNVIVADCDTALAAGGNIRAVSLDINGCGVDTVGLPEELEYYDFDPMLDSLGVARSDSAKHFGTSSAFGRDAPLFDDRGRWFRTEENSPMLGWRSPHDMTEWPDFVGETETTEWGVRSSGRRLR